MKLVLLKDSLLQIAEAVNSRIVQFEIELIKNKYIENAENEKHNEEPQNFEDLQEQNSDIENQTSS